MTSCPAWMQFEFEEVLPYSEFAIRVPQHMIYLLPEILEELVKDEAQKVCKPARHE